MGLLDKFYKRKPEYTNVLNTQRLGRSFKAAFEGIASTYKKEQNIKIHTIISMIVILGGIISWQLKSDLEEWVPRRLPFTA